METGTLMTAAGVIGTALVTTIGHLWKTIRENEKRITTKLDKCEEKHDESNKAIVDLAQKVGEARGYDEATKAIEAKFESFHRDMIDELRNDS